jgi:hypothetical protein
MGFSRVHRDSDRLQHLRRVLPCEVRVISTLHPLFGRLLVAKGFRRWGGEVQLVVVLPDGTPGTIPVDATSVLGGPVSSSPVPVVLSVEGVRGLRASVATLAATVPRSPRTAKTRK